MVEEGWCNGIWKERYTVSGGEGPEMWGQPTQGMPRGKDEVHGKEAWNEKIFVCQAETWFLLGERQQEKF